MKLAYFQVILYERVIYVVEKVSKFQCSWCMYYVVFCFVYLVAKNVVLAGVKVCYICVRVHY